VQLTNPWLLALVGALAAAAVGVVELIRRQRAPTLRSEPPDESWLSRPRPGDIWWAEVPYEDGTGAKVRPCLVLRTYQRRVDVLKITSQDRSARRDHIEIVTSTWDPRATHNSYLDLSDPYRLADRAFSRRAGKVDAATWRVVRSVHQTGWVA
jgi:PemK-like, MazF-like toxin of type II toxin-antitoxin system